MKLSELNIDFAVAENEIQELYSSFNNTKNDYPRDESIVDLFEYNVQKYPNKIAVTIDDRSITYRKLDEKANQIAQFLVDHDLRKEDVVGLYMDRSLDLIISLFGILKAGGAYLPLNIEYPEKQCLHMLGQSKASFLLGQKRFIRTLNQLQWESTEVKVLLCVDTMNIYAEKEQRNDLMKDLWEYVQDHSDDDITKGGWISSYTGEPIPRDEMDEYGENVVKKLEPYLTKDTKILEIGCSSGLTMYRIAPKVKLYYGTDISKSIIDWNLDRCKEEQITNIELECVAAEDIDLIKEGDFDIVIVNSVIQVLSGYNSLRDILRKSVSLLGEKGILFFGDIMDLQRKNELLESLYDYKKVHGTEKTKLVFDDELFVSKEFFDDQRLEIDGITEVLHSDKIHTIKNELTEYRFDTIVKVDKVSKPKLFQVGKNKFQFGFNNIREYPITSTGIKVSATQLSNIMFTSGSTGLPKGVMIEQRSNIRTVVNSNFLGVQADDIWLQTAEISFDPSCQEIFGALLNGATLCLIEKSKLIDPDQCQRYLQKNNISILQLVTALFHHLGDALPATFKNVRKLVIGGDVLSRRIVDKVKQEAKNIEIINAYGPTENCIISTTHIVGQGIGKVSIGKPISNSGIYVLNDNGKLLPEGVAGELYVFGDGLARGYINDDKLTYERFVPNHILGSGRMYRTGDLVRLNQDRDLEFLGRQDNQVKINGKRVELQEIEAVIKDILQIDQALIVLYEREKVAYLCAYLVTDLVIDKKELNAKLVTKIPDHMIPQFFVTITEFPMTTNGKVDKKNLPIPDFKNSDAKNIIAPRNKIENRIAEIIKQTLKMEKVSVDHNFFKVGGHSLLATQAISKINQEFGVELELKTFFSQPTVEKLAVVVSKLEQRKISTIEPVKKQELYEPSQAQKRLWVLEHFEEEKGAYTISDAFRMEGELDVKLFKKTIQFLVQRHEMLRTVFVTDIKGNPKQKILPIADVVSSIHFVDLRDAPNKEQLAADLCIKEAACHFDLEKGPLMKLHLFQLADNKYVLLLVFHHIIVDGWSLSILMNELLTVYNDLKNGKKPYLTPLRIQYKDYAAWHNTKLEPANILKYKEYWLEHYKEGTSSISIPTNFDRPSVKTSHAKRKVFELSKGFTSQLVAQSKETNTTLFMYVLSVLNLLLYSRTNSKNVIIGTPVAGRNHGDIENQIGLFLNTLAIKSTIDEDKKVGDFLKEIKEQTINAFDHQVYPFDMLIEDLNVQRDASRFPLFDVGFTWQNIDGSVPIKEGKDGLQNLTVKSFKYDHQRVKTDLWFHGWESKEALHFSVTYNKDLFKPQTIDDLIIDFKELFYAVVKSEEKNIKKIVTDMEQTRSEKNRSKQTALKKDNFKKFLSVKAKPVNFSKKEDLVSIEPLLKDKGYPLTIMPKIEGLVLSEWIKNNNEFILGHLRKTGALLVRGFRIKDGDEFQNAMGSLSSKSMSYVDQSSPRTKVSNKVYTSTDHPEDQRINMHNELSYSHDWPLIISFYCQTPPEKNGETPIADTREVLKCISETTRNKFLEHGIRYTRNLVNGIGLSWQQVYQTESKEEVEEHCRSNDIDFVWVSEEHLQISWNRPAIQKHPVTGELTWFNHGFFFNAFNLDQAIHDITPDKNLLPFNTLFGNGEEISFEEFSELNDAFEKCKIKFPWQKGDILILDNMSMAHGRESYEGERKILVSMNDPFSELELNHSLTV